MSDANGTVFSNTWLGVINITALMFNAGIILFCVLKGDPANSLHASAMSWAFMFGAGILLGLGIGKVVPDLTALVKKPS